MSREGGERVLGVLLLIAAAALARAEEDPTVTSQLRAVPANRVELGPGWWRGALERNRRVTLPACLDQAAATGRLANLAVAAGLAEGEHRGRAYDDSDVYKILEGAARALAQAPDPALERRAREVAEWIVAAQQPDGYLHTHVQLVAPAERWKRIASWHELYCAGHLIEAALAWSAAGLGDELLDAARRFADCIDRDLGHGRSREPPGHQEIELALLALARATGEQRYSGLARELLERRGRGEGRDLRGEYMQDHLPVREQREPVGHAVRLIYQSIAATGLATLDGDDALLETQVALWRAVTGGHMYVTGGIGARADNEGFGDANDLPLASAYCETCASIALALWSHQLALATQDASFADVLDLELHGGALAGVSLSGDRFFYDNPLESSGDDLRVPWFECACCPSNLVRFVPRTPGMVFAENGRDVAVLLPIAASTELRLESGPVRVAVTSDYPWDGEIRVAIEPGDGPQRLRLLVREPAWCRGQAVARARGGEIQLERERGWLVIEREWSRGDGVTVSLPMPPRRIREGDRVASTRGRVALARGPVVYCLEGVDQPGGALARVLSPQAALEVIRPAADPLGGVPRITAPGDGDELIVAVPYFLWGNRGRGDMCVWIPETPGLARRGGETPTVQVGPETLRASHCHRHDSLAAVADGREPSSPSDHSIPRMTFWDHRGTREWIERDLGARRQVGAVSIHWFDDTGRGSCRLPRAWRLLARAEGGWVELASRGGDVEPVAREGIDRVEFGSFTTDALRLEIELQEDYSAGILEWRLGE